MMTLEDTIELLLSLNANFPKKDREHKVGLYIETKMYNFYKQRGIDHAEVLFNVLKKYDIETVEKASKKLPIIIECFESESLKKFATLSDLPLVFLMFYDNPFIPTYDLAEISTFAHGVGPKYQYIFAYKNETYDPKTPSLFVDEAHSYNLAVHPYILQDDDLKYAKDPVEEALAYLNKGVDGLFCEFP